MPARSLTERIDQFAGLSDRDIPGQLTKTESPDLLNVELAEGTLRKRRGYTRINTSCFFDASVRLNGRDQWLRIPHDSDYVVGGTNRFFHSIDIELTEQFNADRVVAVKGFGTGSSLEWRIKYDVSGDAWVAEAWDGSALVTWTVSDTLENAEQQYRHIEWGWFGSGTTFELRVYDEDATLVGSDSQTLAAYNATTDPIFLGADQTASDTPDTSDFLPARLAEYRIAVFDSTTYTSGCPISHERSNTLWDFTVVGRELYPALDEEDSAFLKGYWKMNDNTGQICVDSASGNNGMISQTTGPTWITDAPTKYFGNAGVEFHRTEGMVYSIWNNATRDAMWGTGTGTDTPAFAVAFTFTPKLDASGAVPDQTLLWSGSNATNPAPVGVRIVSDNIQIIHYDGDVTGGGAVTVTLSSWTRNTTSQPATFAVSDYADQPLRIVLRSRTGQGGGNNDQYFGVIFTDRDNFQTHYFTNTITSHDSGHTGASNYWSLGATVTNTAFPYTFSSASDSHKPALGVLDDLTFLYDTRVVSGGVPIYAAYGGASVWGELDSGVLLSPTLISPVYLKMNEGTGSVVTNFGSGTATNFIYPQVGSGFSWDRGLVKPYRAPKGRLVYDYRRFSSGDAQSASRDTLVLTGGTLHSVNIDTGAVSVLCGGIEGSGLATAAQYEGAVYIGASSQQRPVRFDGNGCSGVGIEAPSAPLTVNTITTSGGSLAIGTYQLYYTFVNTNTGAESNPSPAAAVTIAVANSRVTDYSLPTSPDPQVIQRKVYITAVGGTDGDVAYLEVTIPNNVDTGITGTSEEINSVDTTAQTLEYFDNGPAPNGSVVAIYNDFLFVGGEQENPTRVYFSQPGSFESFDLLDNFVSLDNDAGDPVVALEPRLDVLTAFTRDSRWDLWTTGIVVDPIDRRRTNATVGAVGPQAVAGESRTLFYAAERNLVATDGVQDQNISSPPRNPPPSPSPSIEQTVRTGLNDALRKQIGVALHRAKSQVWFCVASSSATDRNDQVLVYDTTRGTWTKYDYNTDLLVEIEDENDSPWIYGFIEGYLVKLDDTEYDGTNQLVTPIANSSSTAQRAVTTTSIADIEYKGMTLRVYNPGTNNVLEGVIAHRRTTGGTTTFFLYSALSETIEDLAQLTVGLYPWHADFVIVASQQTKLKRLKWIVVNLRSDASSFLKIALTPGSVQRTEDWTTRFNDVKAIGTDTVRVRFPGSYLATAWRMRLTSTFLPPTGAGSTPPDNQPIEPVPGLGRQDIYEIVAEYQLTDAR